VFWFSLEIPLDCHHTFAVGVALYSVYSLPRECSDHQLLVNEEIDAWEEYDGLKLALADDPVSPELAEELDRRYDKAREACERLRYHVEWCPLCRQ
jgi:hypothetical protein